MKISILLVLTFICCTLYAQDAKYGKVGMELLQQRKSSIDSAAPAEIIHKSVYNSIGSDSRACFSDVFIRIKIYDKDKADTYLRSKIVLFDEQSVTSFKAKTSNLVNGVLQETDLDDSQIFIEKRSKYWSIHQTTFPNIQNGSVVDYKYTVQSPYLNPKIEYYQDEIPLRYGIYEFEFPEALYYQTDIRGEVVPTEHSTGRKSWNVDNYATIEKFIYKNVPSYVPEPFVNNHNNLKASVRFELKEIYNPGVVYRSIPKSWDAVAKQLSAHPDFGKQIHPSSNLKNLVTSILGTETDTLKKAKLILHYMQENFRWNRHDGALADEGVTHCLQKKTGNVGDINLTLINMLKIADIPTCPAIFNTIEYGILNPSLPSTRNINYVVASIYCNNSYHYLDATNRYSQVDLLPRRCLNKNGYRIFEESAQLFHIDNLVESVKFDNVVASFDDQLTVIGTGKKTWTNFFKMDLIEGIDSTELLTVLANKIETPHQDLKYEIKEKNIDLSYRFSTEKYTDQIGNKIVLNPMLFLQSTINPLKAEHREHDIEFATQFNFIGKVKITIPPGYKIESAPKNKKIVFDEYGSFSYIVTITAESIDILSNFKIRESMVSFEQYNALKEFWQHKIDAEGQLVSLVKE